MADHPEFTLEQRARFCDEVVEWIGEGKTLSEYCRQDGKPCRRLVYVWRETDPAFDARVAHARARGHDAIAEHCVAIADSSDGDVQRDKLRVETRLKLLKCWDPKRYGDRPDSMQEPSEGDGDKLLRDLDEARKRGGDRAP